MAISGEIEILVSPCSRVLRSNKKEYIWSDTLDSVYTQFWNCDLKKSPIFIILGTFQCLKNINVFFTHRIIWKGNLIPW